MTQISDPIYQKMVAIRRYLHRNPELSFSEYKTTRYITGRLTELGYELHHPLETGCVAVLNADSTYERVIALRADIDALPMTEEGDAKKDFFSVNPGVAHCCGHDAHTANLLGTAEILSGIKDRIPGKVVLIFQPGEEKLPGGAKMMCDTGILEKLGVQEIYGLHTDPKLKPGEIGIRKNRLMASPDEFTITIQGIGGHAASPHNCVDPILVASQIVVQLQSVVSRNVNPATPAVVTVGKIEAGTAHNVIPSEARMFGTVRTFDEGTAKMIRKRIQDLAVYTAKSHGATADVTYQKGYPALINHPENAENVIGKARRLFGETSVILMDEPYMAGEDFSFYLERFKGAFFFLGSGSRSADSRYSWHHPKYNIDETCMKTGAQLFVSLVMANNNDQGN
jgi:amidohydrolase